MADTAARKVRENTGEPKAAGNRGKGRKKGVPNKATAAIRDVAGQYSEAAVRTLVSVMAGGEGIPAAAQVAAAREILDRAHGKPTQPVDGDGAGGAIKTVTEIILRGVRADGGR